MKVELSEQELEFLSEALNEWFQPLMWKNNPYFNAIFNLAEKIDLLSGYNRPTPLRAKGEP